MFTPFRSAWSWLLSEYELGLPHFHQQPPQRICTRNERSLKYVPCCDSFARQISVIAA